MTAASMTLTQVQAFYYAATLGSFTAAADYMGMTQPTVSELVRKIETSYGLPLFVRGGRRLVLTTAGRTLLPWAKRLLDGALGAQSALTSLLTGKGGTVSFGILRNAGYYGLSGLAAVFCEAHPNVHLRLVGQNSFEVADAVRDGELEAGLLCLPVPSEGLEITPLMRQEIVWASSKPERCARPMRVEDIPAEPLILYDAHHGWHDPSRRQLAQQAQMHGITLEPIIEIETVGAAVDLVAHGLGDTILPKAVAMDVDFPSTVYTTSFEEPIYDTFALVTRKDWELSPMASYIADLAVSMLLSTATAEDVDLTSGHIGRVPS
ncbi:LysR family transcriptional regulator [Bifidobacterium margollesii]|uniref:LysR family transcriptional regulator n=1 Tax=Bifidobacterium margollesii TaxID=2020964 RepID=A0A2N5J967_9BIFI|nr:LysR family transcriptional regulator [Bifidobacterium margollesii]PLS30757.1 LysR family transcriptional regulator [Bifidobacterium margollesii]